VNEIFGDTSYFVALQLPRDPLHPIALRVASQLPTEIRIVTSDLVLTEFLAHFSKGDSLTRRQAVKTWRELHGDPNMNVVLALPELLEKSAHLYEQASDKHWSFTDCSSFVIMRERKIREALTFDHHFEQAGFQALMRT
jgi:predicted nucleic acid-binding protein